MRLVFGALGAFGAAATVVAGTAVGYGTMLGSTTAPCSCGSPERRESSASATAPKSPLVREATRREAYDRLAESFDEEIEWHELMSGIKLMRWWMLRQLKGDVLEVAAGCVPRASDHTETKKSRRPSVRRRRARDRSSARLTSLRLRTLSFPNQDRPQLGVLPPRRAAHRDGLLRADGGGVPSESREGRVRRARRDVVGEKKKNTQRRTARRARRLRETSRTAVFMIVRP